MSLMDLFRPKWKHSDWSVRQLAVERLEDPALLAVIAQDDEDWHVREAAVTNVEDQELLAKVATNDESWFVRSAAVERLQNQGLLAEIAGNDYHKGVCKAAVSKVEDQEVLAEVAERHSGVDVRMAAVKRLDGQEVLARIAEDDENRRVRAAAREKVTDPTLRAELDETEKARNSHPTPGMVYMAVPGPGRSAVCSDDNCPCPEVPIARGEGYMYVSMEVAKLRREHPSVAEIEAWGMRFFQNVMFSPGTVSPVLTCEQGARLRNLDMTVAAQDAKYWWETEKVPCRATPKAH